MSYEDYVKTAILAPLGIYDMHVGKNLLSEKQEREVEYTSTEGNTLSVYGTGQMMPWEYGGMNLNAMDAHGGWIATARDLVTLLTAVDGFATKPDILTPATISVMTAPSPSFANYAKGWQVNASNNWWHSGAVPGTATILTRTSGGYTWSILLNRRNVVGNFWNDLDALPWNCIAATSTWPTHDLMLAPTQNSSGITFSNITSNSITANWTDGNGGNRILAVRPNAAINAFPLDGTDYIANANYPTGTSLGTDNRVVYNGTGNSVTVTGLNPDVTYHFRLFEYNKTPATGNNSLYLRGNNAQANQATLTTLPVNLVSFSANKTLNRVKVEWTTAQEINTSHFQVQRSSNGADFSNIGDVQAKGNGTAITYYQFTDDIDASLLQMPKAYYRLKTFDKDGSNTYSPVVLVNLIQKDRFTISPNPAKDILNISGSNIKKVEVLGATGKLLMVKEFIAGLTIQLNISQLSSGIYLLRITDKEGSRQTERLLVK
jgi:hypothetical protein